MRHLLAACMLWAVPTGAWGFEWDGYRRVVGFPQADTLVRRSAEVELGSRAIVSDGVGFWAPGSFRMTGALGANWDLSVGSTILYRTDPAFRKGMQAPLWSMLRIRPLDEGLLHPGVAVELAARKGEQLWDLHPRVVVQKTFLPVLLGVSVGYYGTTRRTPGRLEALTLSAGGRIWQRGWTFDARMDGIVGADQRGLGTHLGATRSLTPNFSLGLGVKLNGLSGHDPVTAVNLGLVFSTGDIRHLDRDQDRVPDLRDGCVFTPEDLNRYEDEDGCPEGGPPEQAKRKARFPSVTPKFPVRPDKLPGSKRRGTP